MNTRNQEQLNQLPKEMLVQLYLQMDSALDTIMVQFAEGVGHGCVDQRPPGGAKRPPSR